VNWDGTGGCWPINSAMDGGSCCDDDDDAVGVLGLDVGGMDVGAGEEEGGCWYSERAAEKERRGADQRREEDSVERAERARDVCMVAMLCSKQEVLFDLLDAIDD
jgi:hypothetical protein